MESVDLTKLEDNAGKAYLLLKAMANSRRLMILCNLVGAEKTVGELEQAIGLYQSTISQHLARLRHDKLVKTRRAGKMIYYSLSSREAESVMRTLYDLYCAK